MMRSSACHISKLIVQVTSAQVTRLCTSSVFSNLICLLPLSSTDAARAMGVLQEVELESDAMQLQVELADAGASGSSAVSATNARFKSAYDGPLPLPSATSSASASAAAEVVLRELRPGHDYLLRYAPSAVESAPCPIASIKAPEM